MRELREPPTARVEVTRAPDVADEAVRTAPSGLLIDAHVHCHECFDVGVMLDSAAQHFDKARRQLEESPAAAPGCLLLAENPMEDAFGAFERLAHTSEALQSGSDRCWRISRTSEPCSLLAYRHGREDSDASEQIFIVAGRQIVVRENIEVLALCCKRRFPVGRSLKSTLEDMIRAGAVPVLPWGFGKWRLGRGTLVRKVVESGFNTCVYLGDNGNRLALSPVPGLFKVAASHNVRVLPGSDPLPMRGREKDAGRYGFYLNGQVDVRRPGAWIRRALRRPESLVQPFGSREGMFRFCLSQVAMQIQKGWR